MSFLLISGVPGCGKTYFGDWLRDNRGYLHIDMESFQGTALHGLWNRSRELFLREIQELHPRVVLTWGYPVSWRPIVLGMAQHNVTPWWFDGDIAAARRAWEAREGYSSEGVTQFDDIAREHRSIIHEYGSQSVSTLDANGTRKPSVEIALTLGIPPYPNPDLS